MEIKYKKNSKYFYGAAPFWSYLVSTGKWEKVEEGRVLQSPFDEYAPGSLVEAGLPDHSHTSTDSYAVSSGYTAGIAVSALAALAMTSTTRTSSLASKSNPIYGNSSTVQPPALIVNIWKRVS